MMNDTATILPPRVRARFIVALILVLPFLAYSIWDYAEARRLTARVDAIVRSGAPITTYKYAELSSAAGQAERYYRAASALAGGFRLSDKPQVEYQMTHSMREASWTPALIEDLRGRIRGYEDALSLVDRAAPLPFEGFGPGWTFNYLGSGLHSAAILCEARAVERASAGDADGAMESIYSEVRLWRAGTVWLIQLPALRFVLERTRPSAAVRAKLAQALEDLDRPDRIEQNFIRMRADTLTRELADVRRFAPARPWLMHRLVANLDVFDELIDAAHAHAAEPAAIAAVGKWPLFMFNVSASQQRAVLESSVRIQAATIERIRCARRLVAGEGGTCEP